MSDFTCEVTIKDFAPDRRAWLYVFSSAGGEPPTQRTQRTWADSDRTLLELRDIPGGDVTNHWLVAFRRGSRPMWLPLPPPDTGRDTRPIEVAFEPEAHLRFRLWIVAGDPVRQRMRIMNAVLQANFLLREELTGIVLEPVEIVDATAAAVGNPLIKGLSWANYNDVAAQARTLERVMGRVDTFDHEPLNVFYVDEITNDADSIHGKRCGADGKFAVAIDRFGLDDLLLHEIGHTLSLGDVDGRSINEPPNGLFSRYNVMRKFSHRRYFFTEGQIVGMHWNPGSVLNTGRTNSERDDWFKSFKPDEVLLGRLALAEDHLAFIGRTSPLPLRSIALPETELEDLAAAACERFQLRAWQLELQRGDADADGVVGPFDLAMQEMTLQDYTVADVARLYEELGWLIGRTSRRIVAKTEEFAAEIAALKPPTGVLDRIQRFLDDLRNESNRVRG